MLKIVPNPDGRGWYLDECRVRYGKQPNNLSNLTRGCSPLVWAHTRFQLAELSRAEVAIVSAVRRGALVEWRCCSNRDIGHFKALPGKAAMKYGA